MLASRIGSRSRRAARAGIMLATAAVFAAGMMYQPEAQAIEVKAMLKAPFKALNARRGIIGGAVVMHMPFIKTGQAGVEHGLSFVGGQVAGNVVRRVVNKVVNGVKSKKGKIIGGTIATGIVAAVGGLAAWGTGHIPAESVSPAVAEYLNAVVQHGTVGQSAVAQGKELISTIQPQIDSVSTSAKTATTAVQNAASSLTGKVSGIWGTNVSGATQAISAGAGFASEVLKK